MDFGTGPQSYFFSHKSLFTACAHLNVGPSLGTPFPNCDTSINFHKKVGPIQKGRKGAFGPLKHNVL